MTNITNTTIITNDKNTCNICDNCNGKQCSNFGYGVLKMPINEEQFENIEQLYFLHNSKQCDAAEHGLYHGPDFDRYFTEEYLPNFEREFK